MSKGSKLPRILTVGADAVISFLFIAFAVDLISLYVGGDVIIYENWFGDLENPVQCRFGSGCVELTFVLLKLALFVAGEIVYYTRKKLGKTGTVVAILLHVAIAGFLVWYVFAYGDGGGVICLIEQLMAPK